MSRGHRLRANLTACANSWAGDPVYDFTVPASTGEVNVARHFTLSRAKRPILARAAVFVSNRGVNPPLRASIFDSFDGLEHTRVLVWQRVRRTQVRARAGELSRHVATALLSSELLKIFAKAQ